ncbi:hypothetical protein Zm00014a_013556 [Zea mays]|uniref:Uncharacterized protein n=1 Tax=Zea mays TaxID=4577 RepID=A0A317Y2V6_MAIZE|nr:hypothetical protein Zm00014a_013556 [Zea mays]
MAGALLIFTSERDVIILADKLKSIC